MAIQCDPRPHVRILHTPTAHGPAVGNEASGCLGSFPGAAVNSTPMYTLPTLLPDFSAAAKDKILPKGRAATGFLNEHVLDFQSERNGQGRKPEASAFTSC